MTQPEKGIYAAGHTCTERATYVATASAHLFNFANGEAAAQVVVVMQKPKQLAINTILDGVHHLSFCHHSRALLADTIQMKLGPKGNLCQSIKRLQATCMSPFFMHASARARTCSILRWPMPASMSSSSAELTDSAMQCVLC